MLLVKLNQVRAGDMVYISDVCSDKRRFMLTSNLNAPLHFAIFNNGKVAKIEYHKSIFELWYVLQCNFWYPFASIQKMRWTDDNDNSILAHLNSVIADDPDLDDEDDIENGAQTQRITMALVHFNRAASIIQRLWRIRSKARANVLLERRKHAALVISNAVLEYIYRPGSTFSKNARMHFQVTLYS